MYVLRNVGGGIACTTFDKEEAMGWIEASGHIIENIDLDLILDSLEDICCHIDNGQEITAPDKVMEHLLMASSIITEVKERNNG